MVLANPKIHTEEDYNNLPEDVRAELIDGQLYYMSAPSRMHQRIPGAIYNKIFNYINSIYEDFWIDFGGLNL